MPRRSNRKDTLLALDRHPVAAVIDHLIHQARDIEDSDRHFVPLAEEQKRTYLLTSITQLGDALKGLPAENPKSATGSVARDLLAAMRLVDRAIQTDRARVLRNSLFLGLFSAFDAYSGDLIESIFTLKPDLFGALGGSVPVADVLSSGSIDELRATILYDYIEGFRRKSYVEQFETLEKVFDVKLRQLERWAAFVECTQRRNLIAHCDGVASEQYIAVCRREGADLADLKAGDSIELSQDYFSATCRLIAEVSLKLGQTLWRKVRPEEIELSDRHLHHVAYEALQFEEWNWSAIVSEFALSQKKLASEQNKLIAIINHAIALKYGGDAAAARHLLQGVDWSAKGAEFKLAVAVLDDAFDDAAQIMIRIGKDAELVEEPAYHDWPLFRDFRATSIRCRL